MRPHIAPARAERLTLDHEHPRAVPSTERKPREVTSEPILALRGVSRRYGPTTILQSVDLEVERGTSVLVAGPNGAGKTTLLRLVAGVITPDSGFIRLAGRDPD